MGKLKSRKLWVTVLGAALTALSQQLGIPEGLVTPIAGIVGAYVLGQSLVDSKAQG